MLTRKEILYRTSDVLDRTSESINDIGKLAEELGKSPYAKKEEPVNPGTTRVQEEPYRVLSKAD